MLKYICYNWFGTIADHALDFTAEQYAGCGVTKLHNKTLDPSQVKEGDIVFVKTDFIYNGTFQSVYLPQIKNKFVLVTGNSSYQVTNGADISSIINSPYLIKWHCTNAPSHHQDKIVPLPIGFEELDREGGDQEVIETRRCNRLDFASKSDKILLPYHTLHTNPQRAALFNSLRSLPFVETQSEKLNFEDYLRKLNEYKFVICLQGSGPDVHRNYEALLVDTVPINMVSSIKYIFDYHKLSGVFVDDWSDLSADYHEKLLSSTYDMSVNSSFLEIDNHAHNIRKDSNYEN